MNKPDFLRFTKSVTFPVAFVLSVFFPAKAEINVGGVLFDDNAFADTILSTNYTGGFGCDPGYVIQGDQLDLQETILGYNLQTWIDYDVPPPGVDPSDYIRDATQYIELGFKDNAVVNLDGPDLVGFEQGSANGIYFSSSRNFSPDSSFISNSTFYAGGMWFCYLDLTDIGVLPGDTIKKIFISNYEIVLQNGDINHPYGVVEVAGVAAVHSAIPNNHPPVAFAGTDRTISLPTNWLLLDGTVSDDGLPLETPLTTLWSQLSGLNGVFFSNEASLVTEATFPGAGVYQLQLIAFDGEFRDTSTVTITVTDPDLVPPSVPNDLSVVSAIEGLLRLTWSPATDNSGIAYYEIFKDQQYYRQVTSTVFEDVSVAGNTSYVYSIQAVDFSGNLSGLSPPLRITIPAAIITANFQITAGIDDVEEFAGGAMQTNSSDLELVYEAGTPQNQIIGLRFPNVAIPQYAQITRAYIEFEVDEVTTGAASLEIHVEQSDNAAVFTAAARSVSSRTLSTVTVPWANVAPWGALDVKQQTPDISALIQEIVQRGGWAAGNALVLTLTGTGTRTAESVEGEATAAPVLHVEYVPGVPLNRAPSVSAGQPRFIALPIDHVTLQGSVSDDGLPSGSSVSVLWRSIQGPDGVDFINPSNPATEVYFPGAGVYVLELTASDGSLQSAATVTVTVTAPDLIPPTVPTGLSLISAAPGSVKLQWNPSTDNNAGTITYTLFRNGAALTTTSATTFDDLTAAASATYSYEVEAVDVAGNRSGPGSPILVGVPGMTFTFESRITAGIDDVEEFAGGTMQTNSSDLELVYEAGTPQNQIIGLRFPNVAIPQYAQITRAYIEFEVDEVTTGAASLEIHVEQSDNAAAFTAAARSVSSRTLSTVTVPWANVAPWGALDVKQQTPDISALIQEIVQRGGWAAGNALVLTLTGTGTRTAESVEGEATAAPVLHVEYVPGVPLNRAPSVSAGLPRFIALPIDHVTLQGSVIDDGLPSGSSVSVLWRSIQGPDGVDFINPSNPATEVYFPGAGVYVLELTASDGALQSAATVTVTVTAPDLIPPTVPTGLSLISAAPGSVKLQWNPSTDNNAGTITYTLFRNGAALTTTSATTFDDLTAATSATYSYEVEAVDVAGNRSGPGSPILVGVPGMTFTFESRITAGIDDVEEFAGGTMQTNSSDLELVYEAGTPQNQIIGLRFPNVAIPQYAQITRAYIEFEVDEVTTGAASLEIHVEQSDNAAVFTAAARSVSSRTLSTVTVPWANVAPWGALDVKQQTPDISALIQEIVQRGGWAAGNALVLTLTGTGTRTAESVEGEATAAPVLHVEYVPGVPLNRAPSVSAGQPRFIALPIDHVTLQGSVSDDGLPSGSSVSVLWRSIQGPDGVDFINPSNPATEVYFPGAGVYVLELTASDGSLQSAATVTVTVTAPDLIPPTVPTGLSLISAAPGSVKLQWNPSTDNNAGTITYTLFRNGAALTTTSATTFDDLTAAASATYSYEVEAVDVAGNRSGPGSPILVGVPGMTFTFESRITAGIDDVEEFAGGTMQTNSSDLELVYEAGTPQNQIIGLRFPNVAIPQYAQITRAYIEFEVDEVTTGAASLEIHVEQSDNAAAFTAAARSVSSRTLSTVTVPWANVAPWGALDVKQQTPDISALIQEIVQRGGWAAGNALVLTLTGTGTRTAESVEGEATAAPVLHVEYAL